MIDKHDTHCCIEHSCKYGDEDCPIVLGIRKQLYLCEDCGLSTEGYYGEPKNTREEQEEYIEALYDERQQIIDKVKSQLL